MNIITLFTVLLVAWLIYYLVQSQNNMAKELREIRVKCVMPMNDSTSTSSSRSAPASYSNTMNYPLNSLKQSLVANLTNMLPNN